MSLKLPPLLWLLPFLCFGGGYYAARVLVHQNKVLIPALIGKPADAALVLLSEKNLNPRVIGLVDEPDLEPGTVINQIPAAALHARPHQTIFLVLTARPTTCITPACIGKTEQEIKERCTTQHIEPTLVRLPHATLQGSCFAQFPSEGMPLNEPLICYLAQRTQSAYIWPSLINESAYQTFEALKKQGVQVTIIGEHGQSSPETLKKLRIIDQRPLPGSLVHYDSTHMPSVHVRLAR